MNYLLPKNLAGRMIALLLLALAAAQLISFTVLLDERGRAVRAVVHEQILARVASVNRLLNDTPLALHARIVEAASSKRLRFTLRETPPVAAGQTVLPDNPWRQQLAALLATDTGRIRVDIAEDQQSFPGWLWEQLSGHEPDYDRPVVSIAVRRADGRWLNAVKLAPELVPQWAWPSLVSVALSAVALSAVVILMVRRITRPLARLTAAADQLGRGEDVAALAEEGPEDVRRTTRAFNRMRERLERFIRDRTRMLAAISHDLRTPLTSLRLRAEFIDDDETRSKILETLDEMQRMAEAALAFARQEAAGEETRTVDLAALIDSLCQDLRDLGQDVSFAGNNKTPYACRPVGLKRALRNLIENAVAYGRYARVELQETASDLVIEISDGGPGIPERDFERVFEPFVRLEESRNRETGGIGLGMAIARSIARGHGGDIILENRKQGGLRVVVRLPRHEQKALAIPSAAGTQRLTLDINHPV